MKKRYCAIALCLAAAAIAVGLFAPRLIWQLEARQREKPKQLESSSVSLNAVQQLSLAARYLAINSYTEEFTFQAGHSMTMQEAQQTAATFLTQAFGAQELQNIMTEPVITVFDEQFLCGWRYDAEFTIQEWHFTANCYLDDSTGAILMFFLYGGDDGAMALLENVAVDGLEDALDQLCQALEQTAGSGSFTVESTDNPPEGVDPDFGFNVATLRYTDANGESAPISLNFSGVALFFNC